MTPDPAYAPPSGIAPTDPIGTSVQAGGSSTTTSRGELSPRQEVNLAGQGETTRVEQDNLNRQTGEDIEKARINEKLAAAQNQLDAQVSWQKQETLREHAASLEESRGRYRASIVDREKAVEAGNRDYWTDQGAAKQFFGGLFIALGHLGSGLMQIGTGHASENTALRIIEGAINRDGQRKKMAIDAANDKVLMLRQGVADARDARHDALQDIDVDRAARWGYVKSYFEKQLAARGEPLAQIAGDARIIKAQQEMDKAEAKILETQAKKIATTTFGRKEEKVETGKAAKPTESQGKDAFLGKNLLDALNKIESLPEITDGALRKSQSQELSMAASDKGASTSQLGNKLVGLARSAKLLPSSQTEGMSPSDQIIVTSGNIMKEMVARKLSGGAIVSDENRENAEKYMIHAGDSPELKKQKLVTLRNMGNELVALSGGAGGKVEGAAPAKGQPAKAAAPAAGSDDEGRRLMNDESIPWPKRLEIMKELGSGRR